jgi:hypothetical protein
MEFSAISNQVIPLIILILQCNGDQKNVAQAAVQYGIKCHHYLLMPKRMIPLNISAHICMEKMSTMRLLLAYEV